MDVVMLSRWQFATTTIYHFLFVALVLVYQAWTYWVFRKRISEKVEELHY
jgi:cytochrome bd-type quinol oxidase subunit 1